MGLTASDQSTVPPKLGEELPVFCERCGYSLHGLQQVRCEECTVLQFHCPECGHHQPINTLRPAAQRILGRMRAVWLTLLILFKLNFFGWMLFFWGVLGVESSYRYVYAPRQAVAVATPGATRLVPPANPAPRLVPDPVGLQHLTVYGMIALPFGIVGRMLLLRWRRGWAVGIVLAALVATAIVIGVKLRALDLQPQESVPFPPEFPGLILYTAGLVGLGAVVAWPIWVAMVRALVPKRVGESLLEWQRSQSDESSSALAHG